MNDGGGGGGGSDSLLASRVEGGGGEEEEEERGVLVSRAEEPVRIQHLLSRLILGANLGTVALETCKNHIKSLFDDGDAVCIGHETLISSTFEQLNAQRMVGKIMAQQVPDSAPVCPVMLLQLARQLHQLAKGSVAEEPIRVPSEEDHVRSVLRQLMATPVLVACAEESIRVFSEEDHVRSVLRQLTATQPRLESG